MTQTRPHSSFALRYPLCDPLVGRRRPAPARRQVLEPGWNLEGDRAPELRLLTKRQPFS
jgi:hypothetical protein